MEWRLRLLPAQVLDGVMNCRQCLGRPMVIIMHESVATDNHQSGIRHSHNTLSLYGSVMLWAEQVAGFRDPPTAGIECVSQGIQNDVVQVPDRRLRRTGNPVQEWILPRTGQRRRNGPGGSAACINNELGIGDPGQWHGRQKEPGTSLPGRHVRHPATRPQQCHCFGPKGRYQTPELRIAHQCPGFTGRSNSARTATPPQNALRLRSARRR